MPGSRQIISTLKKDFNKNCNFLYFIKNYPPVYLKKIESSYYTKAVSDHPWIYISTENERELNLILDQLEVDEKYFAIIEEWMIPAFSRRWKFKWKLDTIKYILPEQIEIEKNEIPVEPLTENDAQTIFNNSDYKEFTSIQYINERIINGITVGIRMNGKLVGWAMTHDDNAMGFLYMLPQFRRQGLAEEILKYLIISVRKNGVLPFAHIEEKNTPSIRLVEKYGFKKHSRISWFEILK